MNLRREIDREELRERDIKEARRIARDCRREMRSWALWWRRGSLGEKPETVLRGAKYLRDLALGMERQAFEKEAA